MSDCHTVGPSSPAKGPSSPAAGGRVLRPMGPSSPADGAEFSGGRVLRGAEFSGAEFSTGPTSPDTNNCLDCFPAAKIVSRSPIYMGAAAYLLATLKWMSRFSWNFQDRLAVTKGTIWNIWGIIRLTPWMQDVFFFFFLGPSFITTIWSDI